MENNFKMLAKTLYGMEPLLAKELRNLGASGVKEGVRSVVFYGDTGFMYKANLSLRTAIKILKPIKTFKVFSEESLYKNIYDVPWEQYLNYNDSLAIDATVHSERFSHSKYVALKSKDAMVDRFREKFGQRPNIDLDHPTLRLNVHIEGDFCTLSLDSSGSSLHKRGYKKATNLAPINEVLAAGMLLHAGWNGQCDFLDPMCGSGTILIEAAMIACNIPPNINRTEFGFKTWKDWDEALFETIKTACVSKIRDFHFNINGYDKAPSAVSKAEENIENANLSEFVNVEKADFFNSNKKTQRHLLMVFNPPYGERLSVNIPVFYEAIGDTLKQNYPDSDCWFITSNLESLKYVGLRPSRKIKLYNGALEARFVKYAIYKGSKKAKYRND